MIDRSSVTSTPVRIAAVAVGLGRALTGAAFVAAPQRAAEAWVGESGTATSYLVRSVGGRDLAIGVGTLAALSSGDRDSLVGWLGASTAGDVADAIAAGLMLDGEQRTKAIAFAAGFGLLGVATAAAARR